MCSGSNSFGFVIRSVCFSSFFATPYTACQMTVGSLPWATPRTRFLIAQCFRLPLLPRFASMMARTFNDVYCTSPGEPGLGRKTTPILECFFLPVYSGRALSPFCSWFSVVDFVSALFVFGLALLVSLLCLFVIFSIFLYVRVLLYRLFFKSFNFSESARILYRRN